MGVNLSLKGYFEVSVNQTRLSRLTKPALLWFPPRWESICPMKGSLRDDLGDQPRRSPRAELDWNPATCFGDQDVDVDCGQRWPRCVFHIGGQNQLLHLHVTFYNFFYFCFSFFLHYLFFVSFLFYNICFLFLLLFLLSLFYYGPLAFTCFFLLLLQMDHDLICLEIFFFL